MRSIVRRDTGESYQRVSDALAKASGIETPTREDLARLDRKRQEEGLQRGVGASRTIPDAQDHEDEGRPHASGAQGRARGGYGDRRGPGGDGAGRR